MSDQGSIARDGVSEKKDIKSLSYDELVRAFEEMNLKPYRALQVFDWMHAKCAAGFEGMTNLPRALRKSLADEYEYVCLNTVSVLQSADSGTRKYLFALRDGQMVESVLMRYRHGNSVCISSQAGCRMGCAFCASTIGGLVRNLSASEMLDQVYRISADIGGRISNVVVMGTGEPLDNYDNLVKFVRLLGDPHGQNISLRNITISTCGISPQIRRLADEDLPVTLALSLHAPSQEKRLKIMPVARRFPLEEVLDACSYYRKKTGRRLTFEYSLIHGFNDGGDDARRLAGLALKTAAHVNLIPVNPVEGKPFKSPDRGTVAAFKNKLENSGINVTIRREMGRDIDGACGQLRRRYLSRTEEETDA